MATEFTIQQLLPGIVVSSGVVGEVSIPQPDAGRLTRLHYFDGKFLRAADLEREQTYHRNHVWLSDQGGGAGVVYGFSASRAVGDTVEIDPGLAIDSEGRVLHLTDQVKVGIGELIERSRPHPKFAQTGLSHALAQFSECESVRTTDTLVAPKEGVQIYLITVSHAEGLCGNEDVYGRLCEDACATDQDRPYAVEGVVLRAQPIALRTPLATSPAGVALGIQHLRSLIASAYFADEPLRVPSLISAAGLGSDTWCRGALLDNPPQVAVAVVARSGASTIFLDPWTSRRERIDPPPRRYWDWRMSMRSWEVFLAQILQFQCQLHEALATAKPGTPLPDPCAPHGIVLREVEQLLKYVAPYKKQLTEIQDLSPIAKANLAKLDLSEMKQQVTHAIATIGADPGGRQLLTRGFVELPPAGYLPVDPRSTVPIDDQVRAWAGDSLDLRFCAVRHDYVAHALEEAQHMDRISLLQGLENPRAKPEVDILVPDGMVIRATGKPPGMPFRGKVSLAPFSLGLVAAQQATTILAKESTHGLTQAAAALSAFGAAHADKTPDGGAAFCFAGAGTAPGEVDTGTVVNALRGLEASPQTLKKVARLGVGVFRHGTAPTRNTDAAERTAALAAEYLARPQPTPGEFDVGRTVGARIPAMWIDSRCEANPFDLDEDQATRVRGEFVLALPFGGSDDPGAFQVKLDVTLTVVRPASAGGDVVACRMEGEVTRRVFGGSNADAGDSHSADALVDLTLEHGPGGARHLSVTLRPPAVPLRFDAYWGDRPLELMVEPRVVTDNAVTALGVLAAEEDAGVLDVDDVDHTHAVSALPIVGAALAQPAFVAAAQARLFPPAAQPTRARIVGPLDWVLFHRRRAIDCGEAVVVAPEPPPAKADDPYPVRVAYFPTLAEVKQCWAQLEQGTLTCLENHRGSQLGTVRFAGGETRLTSSEADLQELANGIDAGAQVAQVGLAGTRAGEEALLDDRARELDEALEGIVQRAGAHGHDGLEKLGPVLEAAGVESIAVVLAVLAKKTLCYEVWATTSDDAFNNVRIGGDRKAINAQFTSMGEVTFTEGDTSPSGDVTTFADLNWLPAGVVEVVVVYRDDLGQEPIEDQVSALVNYMGGDRHFQALRTHARPADQWPKERCPFLVVLLVQRPLPLNLAIPDDTPLINGILG